MIQILNRFATALAPNESKPQPSAYEWTPNDLEEYNQVSVFLAADGTSELILLSSQANASIVIYEEHLTKALFKLLEYDRHNFLGFSRTSSCDIFLPILFCLGVYWVAKKSYFFLLKSESTSHWKISPPPASPMITSAPSSMMSLTLQKKAVLPFTRKNHSKDRGWNWTTFLSAFNTSGLRNSKCGRFAAHHRWSTVDWERDDATIRLVLHLLDVYICLRWTAINKAFTWSWRQLVIEAS